MCRRRQKYFQERAKLLLRFCPFQPIYVSCSMAMLLKRLLRRNRFVGLDFRDNSAFPTFLFLGGGTGLN